MQDVTVSRLPGDDPQQVQRGAAHDDGLQSEAPVT